MIDACGADECHLFVQRPHAQWRLDRARQRAGDTAVAVSIGTASWPRAPQSAGRVGCRPTSGGVFLVVVFYEAGALVVVSALGLSALGFLALGFLGLGLLALGPLGLGLLALGPLGLGLLGLGPLALGLLGLGFLGLGLLGLGLLGLGLLGLGLLGLGLLALGLWALCLGAWSVRSPSPPYDSLAPRIVTKTTASGAVADGTVTNPI